MANLTSKYRTAEERKNEMNETRLTIAIYNENCGMAGHQAYEDERYDGDNWPDDDRDVTAYRGTRKELSDEAEFIFQHAAPDAAGAYRRKVARTLAEAVGYTLKADQEVEDDE